LLEVIYRESAGLEGWIFKWHKWFSEGREDVYDDSQSGWLTIMKIDENAEK
jgi:hypothetical protein